MYWPLFRDGQQGEHAVRQRHVVALQHAGQGCNEGLGAKGAVLWVLVLSDIEALLDPQENRGRCCESICHRVRSIVVVDNIVEFRHA
ncbi:hypothetical protein BA896_012620 [Janthinobacterium lividum]|uniref:Uncharacterized protein n=1 Tax=Janthinobacterium lividum TaxID=29581 RepID=A0A1E8PTF3_9BURK|nr:hypothetical protein BA896_012620 [Janthinobacterium lividum]